MDNDDDSSALIIDGLALVQSFNTHGMKTFGDFADEFDSTVFRKGNAYSKIDVLFDRYRDLSIKPGTRTRRAKGKQSVKRVIQNKEVYRLTSLPFVENKIDLAALLSEEIVLQAPTGKIIVTTGGLQMKIVLNAMIIR